MAKVDKLLYYRRLEEQRESILKDENLLIAEEVKQQVQADVVMIDTSTQAQQQEKEKKAVDKVRTRKEALAEQKFVSQVMKKHSRGGKLNKEQRK
jgi:mevalonate pyrophosphate decarboxylase